MIRIVLANQNQANAVTNNLRLDKDQSLHTFYLASFLGYHNKEQSEKDNRDIASASFLLRISKPYRPVSSECTLRVAGSSLTAGGVCFWYGPVANIMLQIASMASKQYGKNNGGPNQGIIGVKITPRLLKIRLSLFVRSSRISVSDA